MSQAGVIRIFHAARSFLLSNFTLTFSSKQSHSCYQSNRAKGSFRGIINGRDFALLVKPANWFPFAAQRTVMASARQARERAVRPQVASLGKLDKYKWIPLFHCTLCLTVPNSLIVITNCRRKIPQLQDKIFSNHFSCFFVVTTEIYKFQQSKSKYVELYVGEEKEEFCKPQLRSYLNTKQKVCLSKLF